MIPGSRPDPIRVEDDTLIIQRGLANPSELFIGSMVNLPNELEALNTGEDND